MPLYRKNPPNSNRPRTNGVFMDFSKGLLACFDSSLEVCVALHSEIRFSQSFPNWQFTLMRSNHDARTHWHDSVARGRLPWRPRFRRRYALRNADRHAMLMIGGGPAWRGTPNPAQSTCT